MWTRKKANGEIPCQQQNTRAFLPLSQVAPVAVEGEEIYLKTKLCYLKTKLGTVLLLP